MHGSDLKPSSSSKQPSDNHPEKETIERRDEALRRALNTLPKPHKDMKKGKGKQRDKPATPPQKP